MTTTQFRISVLLSDLRVKVTAASVDYVGSITIHEEMCTALGLHERQSVQIRNQQTGIELWTYVIMGHYDQVPPGTLCLNGAAAHLVKVGDIVHISAYGQVPPTTHAIRPRSWDAVENGVTDIVSRIGKPDANWASNAVIEYAMGKVHRPRVTTVTQGTDLLPSLHVDANWARDAGISHGQMGHIVNVTNGQRDVMTIKHLPAGSEECIIQMGAPHYNGVDGYGCRRGYREGDVIIAMSYCYLTFDAIRRGETPPMKLSFPFEKPTDIAATKLNEMWDMATQVLWDEKTLAGGLIDTLNLKPGMKVLDCACGAGFPGIELARAGIDIQMSDGSSEMVAMAKKRAELELGVGEAEKLDIRCCEWEDLPNTWGKEQFDVILWRGNSLPYVCDWNAPSMSNATKSKNRYSKLVESSKRIYETLKPGGVLYVDCIAETADTFFFSAEKTFEPDGIPVNFDWQFSADDTDRTFGWKSVVSVGKDEQLYVYKTNLTGVLVRELELHSIMTYAGFGFVTKAECPGETFYQPFHIKKPETNQSYYDRQLTRYRRIWNPNGKMCYGLCDGLWPTNESEGLTAIAQFQQKEKGGGAMVGPNQALQTYLVNKYRGMEIKSLLDVGCGTGRSSIDLAKRFPKATITGCDPGLLNIHRGIEMSKEEKVSNVNFFHGTVQDMTARSKEIETFHAAWSECALCHAPPGSRAEAIEAIAAHLEDGGIFILNDVVAGSAPTVSAAAQLHILERLGFESLWNKREYMDILESNNLQVMEYIDLSAHQSQSYKLLSAEAEKAANDDDEENNNNDAEGQQVYNTLCRDYRICAWAIDKEECGWALFVCKKVPPRAAPSVDSNCNGAWRANAGPMTPMGFKA